MPFIRIGGPGTNSQARRAFRDDANKAMKLMNIIYVFEKWLIVVLITFAFALTFLQVVLRYFFNSGFAWVPEIVVFSFISFTLAAASTGVRSNVHVGVDVIVKLFPQKFQFLCHAFSHLTGVVLYAFMAYLTLQFVLYFREMGQVSIITEIPIWLMIVYIPVSFLFTALHYLETLLQLIRTGPDQALTEEIHMERI